MTKKKLLLSIFVASLFVTSTLALNACKKNAEGSDVIPTVVTELRGAADWSACAHCTDKIWDFNYWAPIVGSESDSVRHVHEYPAGSNCALTHCRYDGRHHMHVVTYRIDPETGNDHYQDDWIHIGGGGGGE